MRRLCFLLLLTPGLFGCTQIDPYTRTGSWRPHQVNTANLAAMVANPNDLARGVEPAHADAQMATDAVDRLRHDRVRPLPRTGVSDLEPTSTGSTDTGSSQPAGQTQ
jgi:hypothetical protein